MKIKITLMVCIVAMLTGLLAGCGGDAAEEINAQAETTVATEETTVPTEPKTWFEEQGFIMWQGFAERGTTTDNYGREGVYGHATKYASTEAYMDITVDGKKTEEYTLLDTELEVLIFEYSLEEFAENPPAGSSTANIKDVVDTFYRANTKDLTKEEWLEAYKNYKIIWYNNVRSVEVGDYVYPKVSNAKSWSWTCEECIYHCSALLDRRNGLVYTAVPEAAGEPGVFMVSGEQGEYEMLAVYDISSEWVKWDRQNIQDLVITENMMVMIPENVESMAFTLGLVSASRGKDAFVESSEDIENRVLEQPWIEQTYEEFIEDDGEHLTHDYMSAKNPWQVK